MARSFRRDSSFDARRREIYEEREQARETARWEREMRALVALREARKTKGSAVQSRG